MNPYYQRGNWVRPYSKSLKMLIPQSQELCCLLYFIPSWTSQGSGIWWQLNKYIFTESTNVRREKQNQDLKYFFLNDAPPPVFYIEFAVLFYHIVARLKWDLINRNVWVKTPEEKPWTLSGFQSSHRFVYTGTTANNRLLFFLGWPYSILFNLLSICWAPTMCKALCMLFTRHRGFWWAWKLQKKLKD